MPSRIASFLVVAACACLVWPLCTSTSAETRERLALVVAASFPQNDIAYADVRSVFRGQHVKVAGTPIIPINHPLESRLRTAFDRLVLGLTPTAVGNFWVDMRIRDQGLPPRTASTSEMALRLVAALSGGITYADPDALVPGLKILTVDGKSLGQSSYPLQP